MSVYTLSFYVLAAVILAATGLAVTRKNLVHAVLYLVLSFFGSAMLFYLLGAHLLAALEVIVYAGAIMILFLFIIMMLRVDKIEEIVRPRRQLLPAAGIAIVFAAVLALITVADPAAHSPLALAAAEPRAFGAFVFSRHALAVEIVSLLLLIVLFGVLHLGQDTGSGHTTPDKGEK